MAYCVRHPPNVILLLSFHIILKPAHNKRGPSIEVGTFPIRLSLTYCDFLHTPHCHRNKFPSSPLNYLFSPHSPLLRYPVIGHIPQCSIIMDNYYRHRYISTRVNSYTHNTHNQDFKPRKHIICFDIQIF